MASSSLQDLPRESKILVGLVSASEFLNHTYLTLLPPVLGILALDFDVSLTALGVAIGLQAFINFCLQLPFGYLTDNYDRGLTLTGCLLISAVGTFVLAIAPTFAWILAGQALLGVGIAGHHPAHYPLLSDATPEDYRGRVFSVFGFFGNLGFGAPAALYVVVSGVPGLNWRHTFALISATGFVFAAFAAYVLFVHVPASVRRPNSTKTPAGDSGGGTFPRIANELRAIWRSPIILALGVLAILFSASIWGVASFLVTLLEEGYGVASVTASLTFTVMFVAGAGYKLVGGAVTDRFGPMPVIVAGGILAGLSVLALSTLAIPSLIALGVGVVGGNVVSLAIPARDKLTDFLSARDEIGRNFAIVTIGVMIGNTIAPPLFGFLIETAGYRAGYLAVALVSFGIVGVSVAMQYMWPDAMA